MLTDPETAASTFCEDCSKAFYVDTPTACPYCGGENVSVGYPVAVRPE